MKTVIVRGKPYEAIPIQSPQDLGGGVTCAYYLREIPRKDKEPCLLGFRGPNVKPGTPEYNIITVLKHINSCNVKFRMVGFFNEITSTS